MRIGVLALAASASVPSAEGTPACIPQTLLLPAWYLCAGVPGREAPEHAWCRRLLLRMSCFCTQSTEALQNSCRRACMLLCKRPRDMLRGSDCCTLHEM